MIKKRSTCKFVELCAIEKQTIIYVVVILFVCQVVVIVISIIDKRKMVAEKIELKRTIEKYDKRAFYLEEAIKLYPLYDEMFLPNNLELRTESGDTVRISSLLTSHDMVILRISEANCISCVQMFNEILNSEMDEMINRVIYICDYSTNKKILFYKKMLNIRMPIYISMDLKIPIEKENKPYLFVLNKDMEMSKIYFPINGESEMSREYLQIIKKMLNENV